MGSYVWKAEWGPDYRPSMYIGLASLVFSIVMAFGRFHSALSFVPLLMHNIFSRPPDHYQRERTTQHEGFRSSRSATCEKGAD